MSLYSKLILSTAVLGALSVGATIGTTHVSADDNRGQYKLLDTAEAGVLHNDNNRNDGIWTKPFGQAGAQYLGNVANYSGQQVNYYGSYTDSGNGVRWVQINFNGQKAWVVENSVSQLLPWNTSNYSRKTSDTQKLDNPAYLKSQHDYDNYFTGGTYGTVNARQAGRVSDINDTLVQVQNTFKDNNGITWASITLENDSTVYYVNAGLLDYDVPNVRLVITDGSFKAKVKDSNDGVWSRPYGLKDASYMKSVHGLNHSQEYVVDKAVVVKSGTWYHLKDVGWVHNSGIQSWGSVYGIDYDSTAYNRYGKADYKWNEKKPFSYSPYAYRSVISDKTGVDGARGFNDWYW